MTPSWKNTRHVKGLPAYGPGLDLGPFSVDQDLTLVHFLGVERTWKVPDFLRKDRPVLLKNFFETFYVTVNNYSSFLLY